MLLGKLAGLERVPAVWRLSLKVNLPWSAVVPKTFTLPNSVTGDFSEALLSLASPPTQLSSHFYTLDESSSLTSIHLNCRLICDQDFRFHGNISICTFKALLTLPFFSEMDTPVTQLMGLRDQSTNLHLVKDLNRALQLHKELYAMNNKTEAPPVDDFPTSPEEIKKLVSQVFSAMTNYDTIVEKVDGDRVKRVKEMSNLELEVLSWKVLVSGNLSSLQTYKPIGYLLTAIIQYNTKEAQEGEVYLPSRFGVEPDVTEYPNFMARFSAVLISLKVSPRRLQSVGSQVPGFKS